LARFPFNIQIFGRIENHFTPCLLLDKHLYQQYYQKNMITSNPFN